jgi:hypothetical protein
MLLQEMPAAAVMLRALRRRHAPSRQLVNRQLSAL